MFTTVYVSTTIPQRPLGSAQTVARKVLQGIRAGTAEVPCQHCTACCRSGYAVQLTPDEARRLPHVQDADGKPILPRNTEGSCSLLIDNRCTIYTQRPQACKDYDCRVFALVGLFPSRLLETEGFQPFEVRLATVADREVTTALRLAALHPVQQGRPPEDAARLAVLTHARYLPLARRLCDKADTDPEFLAQMEAGMHHLACTAQAHGGCVEMPLRRDATPGRMTRRHFLALARAQPTQHLPERPADALHKEA